MKRRELQKALRKKGFIEKEGGRHTKYILTENGKKKRVMTILSRGKDKEELGPALVKRIMKQLHFNDPKKFDDFVKCPLSYEEYLTMLREKKVI
ncbi:type II toxin-antitoxin system HicA family toxin [Thermococcus indicus]|uniref:Type II toxin-antitoxin system HicA family toxin n=2 Tax=Thermococcus TaxID=2263 RepID=A0A5C0SHW2_9EURY|nr:MULTISPECIES: type II toxin-antitoxin system HicA family toxin [Thermococcus]QDA31507.1 type II toxin-antitoxin system HicA family toxin [Thermococcus indicus]QEK14043.1 type II toxin-antitoxin system HicA family toxin [Thermococcus aciditolerans]